MDCSACERAKLSEHEIRHRLTKINKKIIGFMHSCGYTKDYEVALKDLVVEICNLGDELGNKQ